MSQVDIEAMIRRLLEANPNMPMNEIMKRAEVSLAAASKYKNIIKAERAS